MNISISPGASELGNAAAKLAAEKINRAIKLQGGARLVVSTGSSQFELFRALVKEDIDWALVEVFHLDEYIGLPVTHKASFRKYLYERFINLVPVRKFFSVDVEGDIEKKIGILSAEVRRKPVDLGFIGIGVNCHIAFNDPPADFESREPYIIVKLDDKCKMQQVDEGWFASIDDVPDRAVSMSVWQILQCRSIISVVPHAVKSDAVFKTFQNPLTNNVPATALKQHGDLNLFLDHKSASGIITFQD